jgi:hypothetical protein
MTALPISGRPPIIRIATANWPSDRGGKQRISNIGLQLRENSLIVDQLAASIITLLAQLSGSRENAWFDWKTFAGLGRKSYGNQQGGRGGTGRRKGLKIENILILKLKNNN